MSLQIRVWNHLSSCCHWRTQHASRSYWFRPLTGILLNRFREISVLIFTSLFGFTVTNGFSEADNFANMWKIIWPKKKKKKHIAVNQNYLQWTCKGKPFAVPCSKYSVISLNWFLLIFLSLLVMTWRNRIKVRVERPKQGIKPEIVKCRNRLPGEAVESPLLVFDVCLISSKVGKSICRQWQR